MFFNPCPKHLIQYRSFNMYYKMINKFLNKKSIIYKFVRRSAISIWYDPCSGINKLTKFLIPLRVFIKFPLTSIMEKLIPFDFFDFIYNKAHDWNNLIRSKHFFFQLLTMSLERRMKKKNRLQCLKISFNNKDYEFVTRQRHWNTQINMYGSS